MGDGSSRWAAIHRSDAGLIVRLALDKQVPPGTILHATAETGVPTRDIAEAIGRGLGLPAAAVRRPRRRTLGWLSRFYGAGMPASSDATRSLLGWTPSGPSLIEDLDSGCYYR